jgi:hypothetical protein
MRRVRSTTVLLIVLAFVSFGCASLHPSAANSPTYQQETEQGQLTKNVEPENNWGWEFLYGLLTIGGQTLANK